MPRIEIDLMSFAPALRVLLVALSVSLPGHAFGMAAAHGASPPQMAAAAHAHHPAPAGQELSEAPKAPDCLLTMCCACLPIAAPVAQSQRAEEVSTELPAIMPGALLFPSDPPPRFS